MTSFVSLTLDDGSSVLFQSESAGRVQLLGARPEVVPADKAVGRLDDIAKAAQQLCASIRSQTTPDEIQLEIGVGISGEVGWFFAKSTAAGSLKVTLTWKAPMAQGTPVSR